MKIRNVAIIAHVDHGKTTLIDGMLKQTKTFRANQAEMSQTTILDKNELEREKGITILAKNTAIFYHDYKINIIDTPGHADFGGEVERVINMADGALLIVDSAEGPLAQTKFVLEQAFKQKLKIIVVINKIDRKDSESSRVLKEIEELFLNMAEDESQLNFPVLYGVGRMGKVWKELPTSFEEPGNLTPLFEKIINEIPEPQANLEAPFKMLVSNLEYDSYKGFYAIGRIASGTVKKGQNIVVYEEKKLIGKRQVDSVFTSKGLDREETAEALAGDIVSITGIKDVQIGQTLADPSIDQGFPSIKITEPTIKIKISPNSSPFAGREGEFFTARQLANRLEAEMKTNLGMRLTPLEGGGFEVAGRGELHLAVLIENMRREAYEMEVSKPQVIIKEIEGVKHEPYEELQIEISQDLVGVISEELGKRKAELLDSYTNEKNVCKMKYKIASKNLIGFRTMILTKTKGNGLFHSHFLGYEPYQKGMSKLRNGVLIASESGMVTSYALESLQERGQTFVKPSEQVYEGQIVGLGKTSDDIEMNACKAKKLTNFRSNADVMTVLAPPRILSLEQSLDFIENDELLEVTPISLRLRKKLLTQQARVKAQKRAN